MAIVNSKGAWKSSGILRMTSGSPSSAEVADRLLAVVEDGPLVDLRAVLRLVEAVLPEGMARSHDGNHGEVVGRWRRRDRPFERRRVPGIVARDHAALAADQDVHEQKQDADGEQERADRGDHVERVPADALRIGVDAPGHAEQTGDVHREEAEVEADEHQPEVPLAEPLVEHPPGHLGEPDVEGAYDRETD